MLQNHHVNVFMLAISLALPTSGCVVQLPDDNDEVGESESSTSETGESSTSETGESETSETGESSTSETGGEAGPCAALCEHYASCGVGDPACVEECEAELAEVESLADELPECAPAYLALYACLVGLSCEEIVQVFEEGFSPTCDASFEQVDQACGGECGTGTAISPDPGVCSFDHNCAGEPVYAIECDGSTCSCLVDGVEVGSCEAVSFCSGLDVEPDPLVQANECCGWSL